MPLQGSTQTSPNIWSFRWPDKAVIVTLRVFRLVCVVTFTGEAEGNSFHLMPGNSIWGKQPNWSIFRGWLFRLSSTRIRTEGNISFAKTQWDITSMHIFHKSRTSREVLVGIVQKTDDDNTGVKTNSEQQQQQVRGVFPGLTINRRDSAA